MTSVLFFYNLWFDKSVQKTENFVQNSKITYEKELRKGLTLFKTYYK